MAITIAVDARPLAYSGTGNGRYLHKMLQQLVLSKDHFFHLLSHKPLHHTHTDLLNSNNVTQQIDIGWNRIGPLWLQFKLPSVLNQIRPDFFWATLATLPLAYRRRVGIPSVVNFHDVNAKVAPETMAKWNQIQHSLLDGFTLESADRILCLSDSTKKDILKFYPRISKEKLTTVYPGCEITAKKGIRPHGVPNGNFLLTVGTIEPRKNQKALVEAYVKLTLQSLQKTKVPPLVIVGRPGWGNQTFVEELKEGKFDRHGIVYLPDCGEENLVWCYEHCLAFILVSLHEGFGLPILEAGYFHKPTLLSDIPIFREVGGKSLYCGVDESGILDGLMKLLSLSKAKKLQPAKFDAKDWSWRNRAKPLSRIFSKK